MQKSRLIFLLYFLSQMLIPSLCAGSLDQGGTVSTALTGVSADLASVGLGCFSQLGLSLGCEGSKKEWMDDTHSFPIAEAHKPLSRIHRSLKLFS